MPPNRNKFINWRNVIVVAILSVLLLSVFEWRNTEMIQYAQGQSAVPLDARWKGYTANEAATLFHKLGRDGRTFYAFSELSLDLLFPITYGTLLTMLAWLLWHRPWRSLLLVIITLTVLTDLIENILIVYLAWTYLGTVQPMAHIANLASLTKWSLAAVSLGSIGVGMLQKLIAHLRNE